MIWVVFAITLAASVFSGVASHGQEQRTRTFDFEGDTSTPATRRVVRPRPPKAGINSPPGASRSACGALHHGANRFCPVVNFSPVKQVNINDRWYEPLARAHGDKLELLLAESLRVAHATGALKTGDLKRITVGRAPSDPKGRSVERPLRLRHRKSTFGWPGLGALPLLTGLRGCVS